MADKQELEIVGMDAGGAERWGVHVSPPQVPVQSETEILDHEMRVEAGMEEGGASHGGQLPTTGVVFLAGG